MSEFVPPPPSDKKASRGDSLVNVSDVERISKSIQEELSRHIVGMKNTVQNLILSLLCDGHILLEGVPGIAKTTLAKLFAATLGCKYKRVQFTPDLLPSDVLGTNVFDQRSGTFKLRRGPIFTNILLADEINRAPPKTQSALLEAMAERQVSIEGNTYPLSSPFIVIATMNPIEQEGTYPLPEAQLDRFLLKSVVGLPNPVEEEKIIQLKHQPEDNTLNEITTPETIIRLQKIVRENIYVDQGIIEFIRDITIRTRTDPRLLLGGSPRASISMLNTSKAYAAICGRDYVVPDDIKRIAIEAVYHRLILKPEADLEGISSQSIIRDIIREIPIKEVRAQR
ncbi:MAG: MoxR family ATPase [Candidatus Heimdallarchaeota archaeon]|nr:MoxR family ATPase [Candidatus Heimdallarchaeota archaeon]MCK5158881.1 MoxR family ATPase [Candidatus Heimdallarchaeota archaeon]MCK5184598.1 MoxR family ATPase [Candidatus Heimdallarchaeota archaeon]